MEVKYKGMLAAGGQLAGMAYLISGYGNAGVFLLGTTVAALVLFQSDLHRRWPWKAAVMAMIGGGLILWMQPMAADPQWQLSVVLNSVIAMLGCRWLTSMTKYERQEVRWLLDWLMALALLFCGLLFAMPASLRGYVMQPHYAASSSVWPLGLFPLLVFMPYFPIRLRLFCHRMPRRLPIGVLNTK